MSERLLLSLPRYIVDEMIAHALQENPAECCGLIASIGGRATELYRITNTEHSPYRYNMDAKELLHAYREVEDAGWEILAIYHSHTHSPAYPSPTDVRLATWEEAFYLLISLSNPENPCVRVFTISQGEVTEHNLRINNCGVPAIGSS